VWLPPWVTPVAFVSAGFERRAIPPLTAAWTLARAGLPSTGAVLPRVAGELAELLRGLGLATDASVTIEYTEDALRRVGLPYSAPQSTMLVSGIVGPTTDSKRSTGTK
jgi:hypothetical protein